MTKIESARMMARAMRRLSPDAPIPVPAEKAKDPVSREAAMSRERIAAALTNVALYAIVVELVIKHLWEQGSGCEKAPHHHRIQELFEDLDQTIKDKIGTLYDECCVDYRKTALAGKNAARSRNRRCRLGRPRRSVEVEPVSHHELQVQPDPERQDCSRRDDVGFLKRVGVASAFRNFAIELSKIA